jgi:hypothetical protein
MLSQIICDLYRELPASVLIFKEKQLIHINKYLYEMFSVDSVIADLNHIKHELYYSVFEYHYHTRINNDSDLLELLESRMRMNYKKQQFQITQNRVHDYTIFVITLIRKESDNIAMKHDAIDTASQQKVLDIFSRTKQTIFGLFSTYKGLHIRSNATFIGIEDKSLVFEVARKHLSSYDDTNEYIILPRPGARNVVIARATHIDKTASRVYLSNFHVSDKSAMDRKTIRLKPDTPIHVGIGEGKQFLLYDLSLYALSLNVPLDDHYFDDQITHSYLLKMSLPVNGIETHFTVDATLEKIMQLASSKKAVLTFRLNEKAKDVIKNYLDAKQIRLLHELKRHSDTDA